MNQQFLRRAIPALAIIIILLVLFALPRISSPLESSVRYGTCSRLCASDPMKALTLAHEWRAARPDLPAARHCEALALFAIHDYPHAADAFVALAKETAPLKPLLASQLYAQGAKTYQLAKQYEAAMNAASSAQALDPRNPETKALLDNIAKEKSQSSPGTLAQPNHTDHK